MQEIRLDSDSFKPPATILDAIEHCKDETGYGDYPYFRIQNTINFLPKLNSISTLSRFPFFSKKK